MSPQNTPSDVSSLGYQSINVIEVKRPPVLSTSTKELPNKIYMHPKSSQTNENSFLSSESLLRINSISKSPYINALTECDEHGKLSSIKIDQSSTSPDIILNDQMLKLKIIDQIEGSSRLFTCSQAVLSSHMGYFKDTLKSISVFSPSSQAPLTEISIHCDASVFEWLLWYIADKSSAQLTPHNAMSVLISASFLRMPALEDETLNFLVLNLAKTFDTPLDFSCVNDNIISQIAKRINWLNLEEIGDGKRKTCKSTIRRLWSKKFDHFIQSISPKVKNEKSITIWETKNPSSATNILDKKWPEHILICSNCHKACFYFVPTTAESPLNSSHSNQSIMMLCCSQKADLHSSPTASNNGTHFNNWQVHNPYTTKKVFPSILNEILPPVILHRDKLDQSMSTENYNHTLRRNCLKIFQEKVSLLTLEEVSKRSKMASADYSSNSTSQTACIMRLQDLVTALGEIGTLVDSSNPLRWLYWSLWTSSTFSFCDTCHLVVPYHNYFGCKVNSTKTSTSTHSDISATNSCRKHNFSTSKLSSLFKDKIIPPHPLLRPLPSLSLNDSLNELHAACDVLSVSSFPFPISCSASLPNASNSNSTTATPNTSAVMHTSNSNLNSNLNSTVSSASSTSKRPLSAPSKSKLNTALNSSNAVPISLYAGKGISQVNNSIPFKQSLQPPPFASLPCGNRVETPIRIPCQINTDSTCRGLSMASSLMNQPFTVSLSAHISKNNPQNMLNLTRKDITNVIQEQNSADTMNVMPITNKLVLPTLSHLDVESTHLFFLPSSSMSSPFPLGTKHLIPLRSPATAASLSQQVTPSTTTIINNSMLLGDCCFEDLWFTSYATVPFSNIENTQCCLATHKSQNSSNKGMFLSSSLQTSSGKDHRLDIVWEEGRAAMDVLGAKLNACEGFFEKVKHRMFINENDSCNF